MTRSERKTKHENEIRRMTRRLVRLHGETTAADLAEGIRWYIRAQEAARLMAADGNVAAAAAVIAHLSPREQWASNVAGAAAMLEAAERGSSCPAVGITDERVILDQRAKAWGVAIGIFPPDANHGPKTGAFYANIMGDDQRVCVDSWAARAATGDMTHKGPSGTGGYRRMEIAYQRAARIIGMAPRDLQAAIWIHVRGSAD